MKLFVRKMNSKKTGKSVFCLCLDIGYRVVYLSWDPTLCAELLNISVLGLVNLQDGEYIIFDERSDNNNRS